MSGNKERMRKKVEENREARSIKSLGENIQKELEEKLSPAELNTWVTLYRRGLTSSGGLAIASEVLNRKIALRNQETKAKAAQAARRKVRRKAAKARKKVAAAAAKAAPVVAAPVPVVAAPALKLAEGSDGGGESKTQRREQAIPPPPVIVFHTDRRFNPFIFTEIAAPTINVPIDNIVLMSAPSGFLHHVSNEQLYDSFAEISKSAPGKESDSLYLVQRQSRDRALIAFKEQASAQNLLTTCSGYCSIVLNGHPIKFHVTPWSQTIEQHNPWHSQSRMRGGRKTRKPKKRHRRKTRKRRKRRVKRRRKTKRR